MIREKKRLKQDNQRTHYWKKWGPYLPERQWGTVREDYSETGNVWEAFSFEEAHQRAYRWGEDGIAGISDSHQRLCFAWSFWNGKDPLIKERMFGLSNVEGNHGEDLKECYYFLDNVPTHSYMKYLYKYPQSPFPYEELKEINGKRSQVDPEYELLDTNIFRKEEYFDLFIEYAKRNTEDLFIRMTAYNRGKEERELHLLPTFWARNTWFNSEREKPLFQEDKESTCPCIEAHDVDLGYYYLYGIDGCELLFTENESVLEGVGTGKYGKDGINRYLVHGEKEAVNPQKIGTKATLHYQVIIPPLGRKIIDLRLTKKRVKNNPFRSADRVFYKRKKESDQFYGHILPKKLSCEHQMIARQALAGMLWNKMYYHYVPDQWLRGDPTFRPSLPAHNRETTRNKDWLHLYCDDILSVPDSWEFPAFFSWDTAFHAIPLSLVDPTFAKQQLSLLTQGWYMHPNGQLPAYEWNFFDVNPPVHAWATWRVFKIDKKMSKKGDELFLKRVFHKLLLNFTWWINRKDSDGKNVFQGGFLGLDNISVFNRSEDLPLGARLYQSDATSWMGMFCINMLTIALELAKRDSSYEDLANKFYNHFLFIADAINFEENHFSPLWDEEDGFYYDTLKLSNGEEKKLKVRSLVGLMPLLAVTTIDQETLRSLPSFSRKMEWFIKHRKDLCQKVASMETRGKEERRILAILNEEKLKRLLKIMLDEKEFLSPYGIRSISRYHEKHPFSLEVEKKIYTLDYEPAESTNRLFGGNSNWRGPIWFPINMLIIESLQKFYHYYGDDFVIECPTGSSQTKNLWEVSIELSRRLVRIFEKDSEGKRAVFGNYDQLQNDSHFSNYLFFHEYFHGNTGQGLGASHQLGWTGLIAKLLKQLGEYDV